jgi:hypothetical protein
MCIYTQNKTKQLLFSKPASLIHVTAFQPYSLEVRKNIKPNWWAHDEMFIVRNQW